MIWRTSWHPFQPCMSLATVYILNFHVPSTRWGGICHSFKWEQGSTNNALLLCSLLVCSSTFYMLPLVSDTASSLLHEKKQQLYLTRQRVTFLPSWISKGWVQLVLNESCFLHNLTFPPLLGHVYDSQFHTYLQSVP